VSRIFLEFFEAVCFPVSVNRVVTKFMLLYHKHSPPLSSQSSKKSMECTILRGDGKRFRIVRENDSVVVISVRGGVLFTGEFPHCGVRNFKRGTKEDNIMEEVSAQVSHFIEMFGPQHRIPRDKAIINMFCNLKGMNRLTRLHCSVVTRDRGLSQIPFNMIGYANCFINERDDRCLQNDSFSC
jgi:hypothetical protein